MKKLLLISLSTISLITHAQNEQGITPGSYVAASFHKAGFINDEEVGAATEAFKEMFQEIAGGVQSCIDSTATMPLGDYFKELGAVISRICKDGYGDDEISEGMDVFKFFCLPKIFDEKVKQPLFANVFEQAYQTMRQRHEDIEDDSYFNTFALFLKHDISLQECIADTNNKQEQEKREGMRFELMQCMIGLSDYLYGEDELREEYLQEIVKQTEKMVTTFKLAVVQRVQD